MTENHDILAKINAIRDQARYAETQSITWIEQSIDALSRMPIGDDVFREFRAEAQDAKMDAIAALIDILEDKKGSGNGHELAENS